MLKMQENFRSSAQSPHRIAPESAIGCHRVCSNRVMNPARRACCNQWLRTGNNQSHVEQTSPLFINKREHGLSVHKASASCLRPSPAPLQEPRIYRISQTRGLCDPWLTRPRDSALYAISVRRLTSLQSDFLRTAPHETALALS